MSIRAAFSQHSFQLPSGILPPHNFVCFLEAHLCGMAAGSPFFSRAGDR